MGASLVKVTIIWCKVFEEVVRGDATLVAQVYLLEGVAAIVFDVAGHVNSKEKLSNLVRALN
jgi:hypothetical protein